MGRWNQQGNDEERFGRNLHAWDDDDDRFGHSGSHRGFGMETMPQSEYRGSGGQGRWGSRGGNDRDYEGQGSQFGQGGGSQGNRGSQGYGGSQNYGSQGNRGSQNYGSQGYSGSQGYGSQGYGSRSGRQGGSWDENEGRNRFGLRSQWDEDDYTTGGSSSRGTSFSQGRSFDDDDYYGRSQQGSRGNWRDEDDRFGGDYGSSYSQQSRRSMGGQMSYGGRQYDDDDDDDYGRQGSSFGWGQNRGRR